MNPVFIISRLNNLLSTIAQHTNNSFQRFTLTNAVSTILLSMLYLAVAKEVIGWREDHLHLLLALVVAYFATPLSRKIFWAFLFFVVYWLLYDALRAYPNYMVNSVSIAELYEAEKQLFGIQTTNGLLTPNEYAAANSHPFLDVLAPSFYLTWVPIPMLFVIYLFFTDKPTMAQFAFSFLLVNIVGLTIYYLYPAAPPWYIAKHGLEFIPNTPGDPAGLIKFDEFFNINLFEGMYAKNGNVFAAIPSLHSAFPVLLVYFGIKKRLVAAYIFFFIILAGIWFAAVYTYHHYIIDVLLGGLTALFSLFLLEKVLLKTRFRNWLDNYTELLK